MEYPAMATPSIVPTADDQLGAAAGSAASASTVYLVVDDFGRNGRVFRETDVATADLETTIGDLLSGQYKNPVRVVAFNTAEKWALDVSADVAEELRFRCDLQIRELPASLQEFVDRHAGPQVQSPTIARSRRDNP
jgi:hypothetical protein